MAPKACSRKVKGKAVATQQPSFSAEPDKQAKIDNNQRAAIEKQVQDAAKQLKKLKNLAKTLVFLPSNEDVDNEEDFKSKEEEDTIVAQRKHKSAFVSCGIFESPAPPSKHLRIQGSACLPTGEPDADKVTHVTQELPSNCIGPCCSHGGDNKLQKRRTAAHEDVCLVNAQTSMMKAPTCPLSMSAVARRRPVPVNGSMPPMSTIPANALLHATTCLKRNVLLSAQALISLTTKAAMTCTTPTPAPFKSGSEPVGTPKAGDYKDHIKTMINSACHQFEVLLVTENLIKYPAQFLPMRDVTQALIFTTIKYCFDQWATGVCDKSLTFTNKIYDLKYEQHLHHI
ncbi:hypothetical protein BC628DRAFT_1417571 [Trametes gibbosa]|nr:hypothetical protein BC628DRAFT_1417571 [Trametes gibbosa]